MAAKRKAPKKAKEGRGRMEAGHLTRAELAAPRKKRSDAGTERETTLRAKDAVNLLAFTESITSVYFRDNTVLGLADARSAATRLAQFLLSLKGQARPKKETSHPHTAGGARRNGGRR